MSELSKSLVWNKSETETRHNLLRDFVRLARLENEEKPWKWADWDWKSGKWRIIGNREGKAENTNSDRPCNYQHWIGNRLGGLEWGFTSPELRSIKKVRKLFAALQWVWTHTLITFCQVNYPILFCRISCITVVFCECRWVVFSCNFICMTKIMWDFSITSIIPWNFTLLMNTCWKFDYSRHFSSINCIGVEY